MPEDPGGRKASFWTSLGGILTGLAALITAIAGLIAVFHPKVPEITPGGRSVSERPATPSDSGLSHPVEKGDSTPARSEAGESQPARSRLRPGRYRLLSVNGIPPTATEMRLTRQTDDHFSAHATVGNGLYYDSELFHQDEADWSVQVIRTNDPTAIRYAVPNEVTVAGSSVTFKSHVGTFVWERMGP
jgi:hypothetical protein